MDRNQLIVKGKEVFQRYKYVVLVLLIGVALLLIPSRETVQNAAEHTEEPAAETIEERLSKILSQIEGAGKVAVYVSVAEGELVIYQQDEDLNSDGYGRFDTVTVTDSNRNQSGLIQQVMPPKYQGVIVVCQGAQKASVRLNIIEAVAKVTGLGTDQISVLKMK